MTVTSTKLVESFCNDVWNKRDFRVAHEIIWVLGDLDAVKQQLGAPADCRF